jgi:poly-gamma-glutamate capsule biosynthesis protein CapA/YwtB (metallophosphatase superfamily)
MGQATIADWLSDVSSVWKNTDLLVGNLECPCVETARPVEGSIQEIIFHAPAMRVKELKAAGFSVLTLANNHILNCGSEGLKETIRALDDAGIQHTGAGMNLCEAMQPAVTRVHDRTVAFVAFCYGPQAGPLTPGAAPYDTRTMCKALSLARREADFVVATLHDGLEYSDVPPEKTRNRFRYLAEHGADIVVGHHPHVLQGVEWREGVPIAYSLGDFLFHNSLPHVAKRNFARIAMGRYAPEVIDNDPSKFSRGAILQVDINESSKSIQWHPFRQNGNLRPTLSTGAQRRDDLDTIRELSGALSDATDPRHIVAQRVWELAWWSNRERLSVKEIGRLIRKPKWRHLPFGLKWIGKRLRTIIST